jgi:hypothetical protein
VIQRCFVVLLGEFATDIPRAWLLKINDFQISKFPTFLSLRASNQVVGSSNLSGRAKIFWSYLGYRYPFFSGDMGKAVSRDQRNTFS